MIRKRLFDIVEVAAPGDRTSYAFDVAMVSLIGLSVVFAVLRTVETLEQTYLELFDLLELVVVVLFTLEYVVRLWTAVEHPTGDYSKPFVGRLRYALTPYMLVDLMAVLPFYLLLLIDVHPSWGHLFPILRLLRTLKLVRYSPALETLARVFYTERRALVAAATIMAILLLFTSSMVFLAEHDAQPDAFSSIPAAMWWGIVTLTTVGYGDVTPVTPMGKILGAVVTVLGMGMFALPAGILATGFAQQIKQRDFLVSWGLVAEVPVFASLNARQIADFAQVLEPRIFQAGQTIFHRGDPADALYFIVSGEVDIVLEPDSVRLSSGFFGELGLLTGSPRNATVRAVTRTQLLALDGPDFRQVLRGNPEVAALIEEVAVARQAVDEVTAKDSG